MRLTVNGKVQSQSLKLSWIRARPRLRRCLRSSSSWGNKFLGKRLRRAAFSLKLGWFKNNWLIVKHKIEQLTATATATTKVGAGGEQSAIGKIMRGKEHSPGESSGLQDAYRGLASTLRVVEGGDRAAPSQAIQVYQEQDAG